MKRIREQKERKPVNEPKHRDVALWINTVCATILALIAVVGFTTGKQKIADFFGLVTSLPHVSAAPSVFAPVTFADVVRVVNDTNLTELQKDEFRRKHEGRTVEWTVRLLSIRRIWEHQADSDFLVVFGSADGDVRSSHLEEPAVATFPASVRDDMVDLQKNEIIRFRGVFRFTTAHSVSVENCQLLEHHK